MTGKPATSIAILGAGSWGTAVAIHLARQGHHVILWSHNPAKAKKINQDRINEQYLPGFQLAKSIEVSSNLEDTINQSDEVIIAIPSHGFNDLLRLLPRHLKRIAWLTKGIDPQTNRLLSQCVTQQMGDHVAMAVISGPSFAREVANGLPTAITIAGNDTEHMKTLLNLLHHDMLRVYLSDDMIGVQLGGAMKNVLAIACGISDGLHYGANSQAALITRGLVEMRRLGRHLGARDNTFLGLAGMGDLVLTCTDNQSRNRRFGKLLGQGIDIKMAEQQIGQVVEGKYNASQIHQLGKQYQVELPISEQIYAILHQNIPAIDAVKYLLSRPAKFED
ncbi:NAD(P)H-dependent glycerol-3-phosphate dehydrogenase [Legionella sp. W05-934-2]|jgi:glycerol-3-phosphate dehydrogenase (NAD(P)+)|uniref:NAD(P)H-dependent glycerol-3-phosphate dehydrogenase n=1 Tax=Legionella sp. W05-934-2 TaxID=1198649 RepID=UPI0034621B62